MKGIGESDIPDYEVITAYSRSLLKKGRTIQQGRSAREGLRYNPIKKKVSISSDGKLPPCMLEHI